MTVGVKAPHDVFVTANGTVYVANQNTITEYAPGQAAPFVTLRLQLVPASLSVGRDGTVFICGQRPQTNASAVVEFDPGATRPSREIYYPHTDPDFLSCGGLGADAAGNLYVNVGSGSANGGFAVLMYPPKQTKSTRLLLTKGANAFGAIVYARNDLIVGDPADYAIYGLRLPSGKQDPGFATEGGGDYIALDERNDNLYTVSNYTATLQIYDFATGKLRALFRRFKWGIAISPPPAR